MFVRNYILIFNLVFAVAVCSARGSRAVGGGAENGASHPAAMAVPKTYDAAALRQALAPNKPMSQTCVHQILKDFSDSGIDTTQVASKLNLEDYLCLILKMQQADDKYYPMVKECVQRYGDKPQVLKARLQMLDKGKVWKVLTRDYFPSLCVGRIVLQNSQDATTKLLSSELENILPQRQLIHMQQELEAVKSKVNDSLFYVSARPVIFDVNKAILHQKDRLWVQDTLKNQLLSLGANGRIYARAAASPDGPLAFNEKLQKQRRQALTNILLREGVDADKILFNEIPEDYSLLSVQMHIAKDKDTALVDSLIDKYGHDLPLLKMRLKAQKGGALWKRLLRTYYPQLRAVRLMAVDIAPAQPEPAQVDTLPAAPVVPAPVVEETPVPLPVAPLYVPEPTCVDLSLPEPREPMLSVKTNLLYDAFWMPRFGYAPVLNIWAEYYIRNSRYTIVGEYDFPWWYRDAKHKYFQILNWTLEGRRYFKKETIRRGWFLSAYAQYNYWDFSFDAKRAWQGEGFGGGVGLGYVQRLGKNSRWKMEFTGRLGVYTAQYDPYDAGDPYKGKYYYEWWGDANLFKRRNHRFNWFGPTELGVTISYDLLYRRASDGKVTWHKLFKSR